MEPVRPEVDAYVLDLLQQRTFKASDFYENGRGNCRLLAPMTHLLAETAPTWGRLVAPIVEQVARTLAESSEAPTAAQHATPFAEPRAAQRRSGHVLRVTLRAGAATAGFPRVARSATRAYQASRLSNTRTSPPQARKPSHD
jgi:hypothetical protein